MSQTFEDVITYVTNDDGVQIHKKFVFSTESTETTESEIHTFSLGILDNESIEDAEKDMDGLTKNSIKDWED